MHSALVRSADEEQNNPKASNKTSERQTIYDSIKNVPKRIRSVFEKQSGVSDGNTRMASNIGMQNLRFSDDNMGHMYEMPSVVDPTRKMQDSNDVSLENFFSRPVKIREISWDVGSPLSAEINPWQAL